jgi:hypothetical protein
MKLSSRPRNNSNRISKAGREGEVRATGETAEGAIVAVVEDAVGEVVGEAAGTEDETTVLPSAHLRQPRCSTTKKLKLAPKQDTKKADWSSRHHLIREAAPLATVGLC